MKLGIRTASSIAAIIALIAAGLSFWAGEEIVKVGKAGEEARDATFKSYRVAQSLKSLAAEYELTMNEFYSTVLEYPAYQKKSLAQRASIERELAALAALPEGGAATAADMMRVYKEMDSFRLSLEGAMTSADKDWDRAREALFKMNVLSTQATHQADLLGQSASDHANALDMGGQSNRSQALFLLRLTTALAALAGIVLILGFPRVPRGETAPGSLEFARE